MQDVLDIIKNIESIYDSNTSFQVLKDFERVIDELDIYVYKNWKEGELCEGPKIDRHWVTCCFMWPQDEMPDPQGGKRLLDYDCKVSYSKSHLIVPRKIEEPDDIRPGTKKGKLDRKPIWVVTIKMPKKLIADIYTGYRDESVMDPLNIPPSPPPVAQPAEEAAAETMDEIEAT
tara:strand:- start:252 stop:773 length:522 start_codon:yes stop_codon:yes gene_type:complete